MSWGIRRTLLCVTVVAFLTLWLFASTATAGRLIETGEVADVSCDINPSFGACHFLRVALDYVRSGARDPSRPILLFDGQPNHMFNAIVKAYGGSPPFGIITERPRDVVNFAALHIAPANFSAIVVASDASCGPYTFDINFNATGSTCGDLNSPPFPSTCDLGPTPPDQNCITPDSNRLVEPSTANGARDIINDFYDAGGGILVGSGGDNGDGHADDLYYDFVNAPRGLPFNGDPSKLTLQGQALGLTQSDIGHSGCPNADTFPPFPVYLRCPFNAFFPLPAGTSLKVAEVDNAGDPVTLFQDTDPPMTSITSSPPPLVVTSGPTSATFTFAASENLVTFECRMDSGGFTPCSSPATYTNLGEGNHVFSVRATDAAGNVEAAPPAASWLIAFDRDGDGFTRFSNPADCNDSNPHIFPGAPEARGGHADTDCEGIIDPFLRINAARHFEVGFSGGRTVVTDLAVTSVPTGDTVHLACAGRRRCPFRATSVTLRRGHRADFTHLVRRHKLRAGLVLVVRITGPQSIGFYWSEAIRKPPKLPSQEIRCMNPGSVKPQPLCPSFSP